jgi:hypothetical protein
VCVFFSPLAFPFPSSPALPVCSPLPASLGRAQLPDLRAARYRICEKSDGVRAMLFLCCAEAGAGGGEGLSGVYWVDRKFAMRRMRERDAEAQLLQALGIVCRTLPIFLRLFFLSLFVGVQRFGFLPFCIHYLDVWVCLCETACNGDTLLDGELIKVLPPSPSLSSSASASAAAAPLYHYLMYDCVMIDGKR